MNHSERQVLIADDEPMFVSRVSGCLSRLDYVVERAHTPEQALAVARRLQVCFVILEPNQRGMPWVRFLRALRAASPSSLITVATSFASAAMLTEALELNVHSFHRKPVEPAVVAASLEGAWNLPQASTSEFDEPTLDQYEWEYVNQILRRCDGNISETSRRLAIPRQTLYYKLRKQPRSTALDPPARVCRPEAPWLVTASCMPRAPDVPQVDRSRPEPGASSGPKSDWFFTPESRPRARVRLFCFPYAGAWPWAFHGWAAALPHHVEVCALCLPGRGRRASELPLVHMETLVARLSEAIRPRLDRPYALFGHSLGAAIAFELAGELARVGAPPPLRLIVSGAAPPGHRPERSNCTRSPMPNSSRSCAGSTGRRPRCWKTAICWPSPCHSSGPTSSLDGAIDQGPSWWTVR